MAIVNGTDQNFSQEVEQGGTVLVDFWAPWCGPCRNFAPVFDKASEEHEDITFAKVNTEEHQELAGTLGIRSIPTPMVFREQVLLYSQAGALSSGQLDELITQVKGLDMAKIHAEIAASQDGQDTPQA